MAASNQMADRRVVPLWRTFQEALESNELSGETITKVKTTDEKPFLLKKESDWLANKELPFAIDLVGAATMFGTSDISKSAANYVLENEERSSHVAVKLAKKLLGIADVPSALRFSYSQYEIIRDIKSLKARRISQPSNAFVWADLARLYVLLGQKDQASYALKVALNLAPTERFILRATTRFLLHDNEPDAALRLLRTNPRTPTDPWLASAEIAVSSIVKKTPKFTSQAKQLIQDDNISDFHKSELASSFASLELFSGSVKKASKLFSISLKAPTENSLAQFVWASKRNGLGAVNPELLKMQGASEARTFDAHNNGKWVDVIKNAKEWTELEWYSARPRIIASGTAAYFFNRSGMAEEFVKDGLKISPGHPGLVNSLAFALAWNDKPAEAAKVIETLDKTHVLPGEAICLLATAGLILFRSGEPAEGKVLYEKAIASAAKIQNDYLKNLAELHLAHELILQNDPLGPRAFKKAHDLAIKQNSTGLPYIAVQMASRVMKDLVQTPQKPNEPLLL